MQVGPFHCFIRFLKLFKVSAVFSSFGRPFQISGPIDLRHRIVFASHSWEYISYSGTFFLTFSDESDETETEDVERLLSDDDDDDVNGNSDDDDDIESMVGRPSSNLVSNFKVFTWALISTVALPVLFVLVLL